LDEIERLRELERQPVLQAEVFPAGAEQNSSPAKEPNPQPTEKIFCATRRHRIILILSGSIMVVALILGLVFGLDGDPNPMPSELPTPVPETPTPSPTTLPPTSMPPTTLLDPTTMAPIVTEQTPSPTNSRFELFWNTLFPVSGEALNDESTPQYETLRWLAYNDTLGLPAEDDASKELVERYVIALLYFSTNGAGWDQDYKFLQGPSICDWNDFDTTSGVNCDSDGYVSGIRLGTFVVDSCHNASQTYKS